MHVVLGQRSTLDYEGVQARLFDRHPEVEEGLVVDLRVTVELG